MLRELKFALGKIELGTLPPVGRYFPAFVCGFTDGAVGRLRLIADVCVRLAKTFLPPRFPPAAPVFPAVFPFGFGEEAPFLPLFRLKIDLGANEEEPLLSLLVCLLKDRKSVV